MAAYYSNFNAGSAIRDMLIATIIGVLIAGIFVLLISTAGETVLSFLIKKI